MAEAQPPRQTHHARLIAGEPPAHARKSWRARL